MGDRAQVKIKDTGVFLYTHWNGYRLVDDVKQALAREVRWDDPEYLARIIFDQMTEGSHGSETGHGISTSQHGDVGLVIELDCKKKIVSIKEDGGLSSSIPFSAFIYKEG